MKKIFIILFIFNFSLANSWNALSSDYPTPYNKEIISSSNNEIIVRFTLEGYSLTPLQTPIGEAFKVSTILAASLLEADAPDVQKLSASLIIPNNKHMSSRVESSEFIEIENIIIAPSKGNLSRLINPDEIEYSWGAVYNSNTFYPGKLTDLNTPYILRDFRGQAANVYPFQYNPVTKILRIYTEIIISVMADGPGTINLILNENLDVIDHDFIKVYNNHFDNFNISENRFDFVEEQGNMLIISHGSFIDEMQQFINWKNSKGIPTEIIDVEEIGGNSSSIEAFVDDYYHENGLTFLLLVGDEAQIPAPEVSGSASDPSYGFIDGNDSYAELFVGRFSASNPPELITQVERTLDYEQNAQSGADWYHTTLSVGSNQGPGWGGLTDDVFLEEVIDPMLLAYTYESTTGVYDSDGTLNQGIDAINDGVSIINYTGHGWQEGWSNGAPLEVSHVDNLDNAGKLPFVITVGCNVGEFDNYTNVFSESWLRATNNGEAVGGIGHFGSTISQSWEPPMHGQYGMNLILTENSEDGISHTAGGIVTNGCMYMNDMVDGGINETNYWTLFGDPSVHLRTDEPTSLNASYPNSIVLGTSSFDISYTGSEVTAAFSQNYELLAYGYGNNGIASIDLSDITLQPGEYDLVLTGYNAFTEQVTIDVISPEGAYIVHEGYTVENLWDNSSSLLYGQTSHITLSAQNVGIDNAYQVTASVSTDDMYTSIFNGQVSFGDISINSNAQSNNNIEVELLNAIPDGHLIEFSVEYSDGESSWEDGFSIAANAPLFIASNPQIIDTDGNGTWDAGESATIIVNCANEGSADFNWYPGATISTNSEYVYLDSEVNANLWYAIFAGTSYEAGFAVEADAATPDGANVSFTVTWGNSSTTNCENDCVENHEFTFSTTIGIPLSDDADMPENLVLNETDGGILLEWEEPAQCPPGQFSDCNDQCVDVWYENWIGDGLCDDGGWGYYFNCEEFNFDGGDCGGGGTDPYCGDGICDELTGEDLITCPDDCSTTSNGSCANSCGGSSADGCWCDIACSDVGDCCIDYCDYCFEENENYCSESFTYLENAELNMMYNRTHDENGNRLVLPGINTRTREEPIGYNIFKDGSHIAYVENTFYLDEDYLAGTTYCYSVSALYEESQSYQSDQACLTTENPTGDISEDGNVDVLDIVMLVNMIIGSETPNYQLGDLNNDGSINVIDVIIVVNIILDPRYY